MTGVGEQPYPNNPLWTKNQNPFFFTQFLTDEELFWWIGMGHQEFYALVDKYARPYMAAGGPRGRRRYVHIWKELQCNAMWSRWDTLSLSMDSGSIAHLLPNIVAMLMSPRSHVGELVMMPGILASLHTNR